MSTQTRKKNVQMGYVDGSGFHPIRGSEDYDEGRVESESHRHHSSKKLHRPSKALKSRIGMHQGRLFNPTKAKRSNPLKVKLYKFYVGQKLATRFIGDHNLILRGTVLSRTPKFVTVKLDDGEVKRCGVHKYQDSENISPLGNYSMAPMFNAKDGDRRGNPLQKPARSKGVLKAKNPAADGPLHKAYNVYTKAGLGLAVSYLKRSKLTPTQKKNAIASLKAFDRDRKQNPAAFAKKNPDPFQTFAHAAGGILSALQIHQMVQKPAKAKVKRRKAKRTGVAVRTATNPKKRVSNAKTPSPQRRKNAAAPLQKPARSKGVSSIANRKSKIANPSARVKHQPKGDLFVLTIGSGDDLISVYLHDGKKDGFSKRFKTMTAARAYATRNKVKMVDNPKTNGIIKRAWARHKATSEYKRELRLAAAAERARKRRAKHEAAARNPRTVSDRALKKAIARADALKKPLKARTARLRKLKGLRNDTRRFLGRPHAARRQAEEIETSSAPRRLGGKKRANPKAIANRKSQIANPKTTARRKTYESFQGRRATKLNPFPVSHHAGANPKMDQLGELIELKLADGRVLKLNPAKFKLCAKGGRLWIVGGRFAKADASQGARVLNPIEYVDHVVYRTHKPHHGDPPATHYIHQLGEVSGKWPLLAVDNNGFPVLRGGAYKIRPEGIVD